MTKEQLLLETILKQLDIWITDAESLSTILKESGNDSSQIRYEGMSQAYWNVKQLIEVNK